MKKKYVSSIMLTIIKATFFFSITFLLFFNSCTCDRKKAYEREPIVKEKDSLDQITITIYRYEKDLFAIPLDSLKEKLSKLHSIYYPFYSQADLDNPANLAQLKSYLQDYSVKKLYEETMKQYPNLDTLEKKLKEVFIRIKSQFPDWKIPRVYTYVSGGDIEYPIKYAENTIIIALDMFLGKDFHIYKLWQIPEYLRRRMSREYIIPNISREIARAFIESKGFTPHNFLDKMIFEGKLLYFNDITQPDLPDSIKIGYSAPQMFWAEKNEGNIWSFFIEKKLLYTTDWREINKYFMEAPFTSTFSRYSAPRVGKFIGWRIVRSYMSYNKAVTVEALLKNMNAQDILQKSNYRPEKNK
ncbi:MAG: hypothetical protein N2Z72_02470 [Bacteroidales bacterium]|nr:hypothetical protein [Bacteroidales bacterium]